MRLELSSSHEVSVTYRLGDDEATERRPLFRHELSEFDRRFGRRNLDCLKEIKVDEDGRITWWWFDPPAVMVAKMEYADGSERVGEYRLLCQGGRLEGTHADL